MKTKNYENLLLKKRTFAFTIDLALILILNKAVVLSYTNFIRTIFYQLTTHTQQKILTSYDLFQLSTLWIVFWSYFILSYYLGEGKTPGKIIFGLQTFSQKINTGLTLTESLMRTMAQFFCIATGFFLLALPYFRKDNKSLADIISNTWVAEESSLETGTNLAPVLELVPIRSDDQSNNQDRAA